MTQGGVRTASTGAVDLGTSVIVGKGKKVQANVMFVHDRPPFIDGKDYIGTVVSMSPKDFDEHQAFYKINSVIGRAMFATDAGNIHATVGSFNGKIQGELGADWKLTKATSVIADATLGKRSSLKEGASAFVAHEVNPGFTIYAGAEYLKGQLLRSASARADGTVARTKWSRAPRRTSTPTTVAVCMWECTSAWRPQR